MTVQSLSLEAALCESTVSSYFDNFNQANYQAVAALFGDHGTLQPPLEDPIVGSGAITRYLTEEAQGMTAIPLDRQITVLENHTSQITVLGRVKTPLFTVSVQWHFVLDAEGTIQQAEIKLLASLQELLQFNRA